MTLHVAFLSLRGLGLYHDTLLNGNRAMYVLFTRYHGLLLYRGRRVSRPSCVLTKSNVVAYDASQQEYTLFVVTELINGASCSEHAMSKPVAL